MRTIVARLRPDLHQLLGADDESWQLEPFAFACFSSDRGEVALDQLLADYIPVGRRPVLVPVLTDEHGSAYVPRIGHFATAYPSTRLDLNLQRASSLSWLERSGVRLASTLEETIWLAPPRIELLRRRSNVLDGVFAAAASESAQAEAEVRGEPHREALEAAISGLLQLCPDIGRALAAFVRRIVVFESPALNSFATPTVHGAVFLNASLGSSDVCLLEDFVHQGGHVLFRAATADGREYFADAAGAAMSQLNGQAADRRSVYEALHGIFTLGLIVEVLDSAKEAMWPSEAGQHELDGRLAFALMRLAVDLRAFSNADGLTPEGVALVRNVATVWTNVCAKRADRARSADLTNQTYNFSYSRYAALNPRQRVSRWARK